MLWCATYVLPSKASQGFHSSCQKPACSDAQRRAAEAALGGSLNQLRFIHNGEEFEPEPQYHLHASLAQLISAALVEHAT